MKDDRLITPPHGEVPTKAAGDSPDLGAMAENLLRDAEGIWVSRDAAVVEYDSHEEHFALEEESFWFRHRNRIILGLIRRFPPPGPILDVGGGNGFVAAAIERAGHDTIVLEPGRAGARHARQRGLPCVVCATVEAARFRLSSLGGIGLFDVIEHIEDDRGFLRGLRGLLGPRGRLYVTVPSYRWLWSVHDTNEHHFRRYTVGRLAGVLEEAGFRVLASSSFFWPLPLPVFLMRAVPTRLGWLRPGDYRYLGRDHRGGSGLGVRVMGALLAPEVAVIGAGGRVPFGTSCLAVAEPVAL